MSRKTVILTTETSHHLYYVRELIKRAPIESVFVEKTQKIPAFDTFHPFEKKREEYELEVLLGGSEISFENVVKTSYFNSVNELDSIKSLEHINPDLIIVFGTGKISEEVIQSASKACLNLHGGNPEEYRGLDSHLWSIYHRDFENLMTTLHYVENTLDTGDIVCRKKLNLTKNSELFQLRAINTKTCVDLSEFAINNLDKLPRINQSKKGRYYSFMPTSLKELCKKTFAKYTSEL